MSAPTATTQPVPASSVGRLIYRHPVAAFLVLVYGLSWPLYLPAFLSQSGIGLLSIELSALPANLVAVLVGITLPAYLVTRVTPGPARVRELRRHYTRWRVGPGWYLLALFTPPLTALLGASLGLGAGPLVASAGQWQLLLTAFLPQALVGFFLVNFLEEGGWTGFLLPRLQARRGPLRASLLVASAVALFRVPLLFIVGGLSDERIPPDRCWFYRAVLFVVTPPARVLVRWVWNGTRGSVPVVGLLHGAWNATSGAAITPAFVPGDTLWVWGAYSVRALAVLVLTRGRLAYRGDATAPAVDAGRRHEPSPRRA
jgi:membrane protease YdiL (CAAX protease family)